MIVDQKNITLLIVSALTSICVSTANAAAPNAQRWQAFNQSAVAEHIVPNYQSLADQSESLVEVTNQYCAVKTDQAFSDLQLQFKKTTQAWQKIQHIQFGPVTLLMRNFSLQYWPDKKNLGGRQLATILEEAKKTEQKYDNEYFARASVAVKGYPALERLLFDKKLLQHKLSNPSYCAVLQAISGHIAANTQAITSEWQLELENYAQYSEDSVYESSLEAATDILKALVEPLEAISDGKIKAPLGSKLAKMRWRKSESWRSEQSLKNISSNLIALQHLYAGINNSVKQLLIESDQQVLADDIDAQFTQALALLETLAEPKNMQYQQSEFDQLLEVQNQLKRLSDNLLSSMTPLKVKLGFNRRDGD